MPVDRPVDRPHLDSRARRSFGRDTLADLPPVRPSSTQAEHRGDASSTRAEPTRQDERITNLDAIRGVAVLGILVMNVVSYGFVETAPYFNLDAGGSVSRLDWLIGGAGEILADQKFMGLFSMLFGAGNRCASLTDRGAPRPGSAGGLPAFVRYRR